MKPFLLEILADPITGAPLSFDSAGHLPDHPGKKQFKVTGGIPDFVHYTPLAEEEISTGSSTALPNFKYQDHYEKDAELFDYAQPDEHLVTRNERKRNRECIVAAVPEDADTILDIGCGGAWVASQFLPKGRKVISMDISTINPTKALAAYPHSNHAAVVADAFHLPFLDGSLDCIIASEVIEHVADPKLFITRILKKVKKGGKLLLMTPYNETIEINLCIHCNKPTPKNGHLHSFNETKINALVPLHESRLRTTAFNNKYLLKSRVYNLLSFLPFKAWKLIDSMANVIFKKQLHFLIDITKTC